jgi:hypothetical protein
MAFVLWTGLTKPLDHTGEPDAMTPTPMTTPSPPSAPRTGLRRFASVGLVVVGVLMLVGLAAWRLAPSHPDLLTLGADPSGRVGWTMASELGGPAFDPTTAQTTTAIRVYVASWPSDYAADDDSWLATPAVTYTPWAVMITLHESDSFGCFGKMARPLPGGGLVSCWYDIGGWVPVQLSEPLGGRALFDGSASPPHARPYP